MPNVSSEYCPLHKRIRNKTNLKMHNVTFNVEAAL
uniref:Uncharacterized protein n=1 Tax=Anguilla anguilla TaxID=7936 RepID=A0A0E9RBR5_ANGAN